MLKHIVRTLFACAVLSPGASVAGEAVWGVWLRGGHAEKMEFFDCDGALCSKGVLPEPDGTTPMILRHAAKIAPNQWKGDLFNPENGKLYSGTITLNQPDKLTLKGCLVAFLCQSETWTRVASAHSAKPAAAKSSQIKK